MSRAREVSCSSSALSRPRSSRRVASVRSCTSAPAGPGLARSNASASLTRGRSSSASFAAGAISGMACSSHWGRPARFTHIRTETARLARSAALLSAKSDRMSAPVPNPLLELRKLGQSAWLDDISRRMLRDGTLARLIRDDRIAGLTSNPAIFGNAITTDPEYARPIAELVPRVSSVASFFLSRIDTAVDSLLDALAARGQPAARALRGKAAIASACRAYEIFEETIATGEWQSLAERGARPQRLLWASTSTKDPSYGPVKYIEELIVPKTVNTMPLETLNAYRRLGRPELRLERHIAEGCDTREALERLDIDLEAVAQQLEREGVMKFIEPFDKMQTWLEERRRAKRAS